MELIPKAELEKTSRGSYFVSRQTLIAMPFHLLEEADKLLMHLVETNPGYEFMTKEEFRPDGITIFWRLRK